MPPLPPCSSDTYSKIAELEAQSATLANNYKNDRTIDYHIHQLFLTFYSSLQLTNFFQEINVS